MSGAKGVVLRGLYAITPTMRDTDELVKRTRACLEGGARIVQYRFKELDIAGALAQARSLSALCREHEALFIVNDSLELAREVGADGVHLGRDDGDAAAARRAWPQGTIGVSCYADLDRARDAAAAGADYIGVGSMFASATKPAASRASLNFLRQARAASGIPVAAIGGITPDNAASVIAAGADMVAVISAVFDAPDIRESARALASLFEPTLSGVPHVRA